MEATANIHKITKREFSCIKYFPVVALVIFISTYLLEGMFRYALVNVGFAGGAYLRDMVVFGLSAIALAVYAMTSKLPIRYWVVFGLFSIHLGIGLISLGVVQAIFGAKVLASFLVGMSLALFPSILNNKKIHIFLIFTLLVACCGVFVNRYISYPWEGLSYSVGDIEVVSSRQWWSGGISRLAGFGRLSVDTAISIAMLALVVSPFVRSMMVRAALIAVAIVAVVFTTTKAVALALILLMPLAVVGIDNINGILVRSLLVASFFFAFMAPFVGGIMYFNFGIDLHHVPSYLLSFGDRLVSTWPRAFDLVSKDYSWIWGRGIGGLGIAQRFEPLNYNPGDNVVVFSVACFGLAGLVYLYALIVGVLCKSDTEKGVVSMIVLIVLFFFLAGITTNMFGNPLAVLFLGFAYMYVNNSGGRTDEDA